MFNELRMKTKRGGLDSESSSDDEGSMTIAGRANKKAKGGLSLGSCFQGYSNEETLGGDDQWYCNMCKEHRDITKKLEIYSTPKILVLQLKRFQQRRGSSNRTGMYGAIYAQIAGQEKNDALVDFPLEGLDIREHVVSLKDAPEPILYDLIGVSNHFGSLNGGHYTAACKNDITGDWSYFNDSSVSSASKSQIVSSAAYVLFYRRRDEKTAGD